MKLKSKKLSAKISRRIAASLLVGGFFICAGSSAFAADANGNSKTVTSENYDGGRIMAGYSSDGNASNNNLDVSDVDAGNEHVNAGETDSATANTDNNKTVVRNVDNISFLHGGYAWNSNGSASHNVVDIWDSTIYHIHGGHTGSGVANYNTVNFYSGNVSALTGAGYAYSGEASFNTLNIYGGTLNGLTQGGYVMSDGKANGNKVNIYGGEIHGNIYGGYVGGSGEVSGNEINVYGGDLSDANIYAGYLGGNTDLYGSGNSLNFYAKDITAQNVGGFDRLSFYLPSNVSDGDTVLTLTDGAGTSLDRTKISLSTTGGSTLREGDSVILMQNNNGMNFDLDAINRENPNAIISHGISWDNYASFESISNGGGTTGLKVNVGAMTTDGLKRQTQLLGSGVLSAISQLDYGTARILEWLPPEEVELRNIKHTTPFEIFAGTGGSVINMNTGGGSKLKTKDGGQNIGVARVLENRHGLFIFAPITDYGADTYKSSLSDGTRGGGNSQYFTAGLIARQWNTGGTYYEASFRAGEMKTGFVSDNFKTAQGNTHISYKTHAPCYAGHIRIGWRGKVSPNNVMDIYGIYSQNHVGGIEAEITPNEKYTFESTDSKKIRLGARLTRDVGEYNRFYSGIALHHEFGGEVHGHYMGFDTRKMQLKGTSGMIELGWQRKPAQNSAVMVDTALVGWIGRQKGMAMHFKVKRDF